MIAYQHAVPQVARGGELVEHIDQQLGGQFLYRREPSDVFHINFHLIIPDRSQGS